MGYGLDNGVRFPADARDRLDCAASRQALGLTQPPIQWATGVMRPGYETDHSPLSNAEVTRLHGRGA
jgi:hypothetical protein